MKAIVTIVSDNGTVVQEMTLPMQRERRYRVAHDGYALSADYSLHIKYSVLEDSLKALGESPV